MLPMINSFLLVVLVEVLMVIFGIGIKHEFVYK